VKTDRMRPLWKTVCIAACVIIFFSIASKAQCGNTKQSLSYDTLITGTGNDSHIFTLSQFDPSIGTLVSAKINSTISVNYGFTLKNVEAVQRDFSVSVGRYDHYTSASLSAPYTNLIDTNIGDFLLNPGDTVSKSPYTILYRNSQNDSITSDVVNFLGNSTVAFDYKPITYTNLTGSNVYYYSATANDTIHFSITYYYCSNTILANDLLSFSAKKENTETIKLSWSTNNFFSDRNYEIQASIDSSQFSSVASIPEDITKKTYQYDYKIAPGKKGKIFFRLKIITTSGSTKYSEIKMIDIDEETLSKELFVILTHRIII